MAKKNEYVKPQISLDFRSGSQYYATAVKSCFQTGWICWNLKDPKSKGVYQKRITTKFLFRLDSDLIYDYMDLIKCETDHSLI